MIIRNLRNPRFPDHFMPPVTPQYQEGGLTLIGKGKKNGKTVAKALSSSMYRVLVRNLLFSKKELIIEGALRADKKRILIGFIKEKGKYA